MRARPLALAVVHSELADARFGPGNPVPTSIGAQKCVPALKKAWEFPKSNEHPATSRRVAAVHLPHRKLKHLQVVEEGMVLLPKASKRKVEKHLRTSPDR